MNLSVNEVMSLAARAARGAGAPPAQAAAFGRAAMFHLAAGRAAGTLTAALESLPQGPILTLPLDFIRVLTEDCSEIPLPPDVATELVQSYAEAQPFLTTLHPEGPQMQITVDRKSPSPGPAISRITMSEDLFTFLNHLAARILVPESEASRIAGAGAGLTDND